MGQEKLDAANESHAAMTDEFVARQAVLVGHAMQHWLGSVSAFFALSVATTPAEAIRRHGEFVDAAASSVVAVGRISNTSARVVQRGLTPIHAKATSNARRLCATSQRLKQTALPTAQRRQVVRSNARSSSYEGSMRAPSPHRARPFTMRPMKSSSGRFTCALAIALSVLAGCSSAPQQAAQWVDPSIGTQSRMLQGEKVLIACDAYDVAMQRICQDQLYREVLAKGATPVTVPAGTVLVNDRELDGQLMASAQALGARAVFTMTLTPATTNAGPGVSLGIGGFSFGRGGGGGVGLSVPIGGQHSDTGFAANGRVTDVGSNRLVWTATLVAAPSADLGAQFAVLSRSMLDSAQSAGLF